MLFAWGLWPSARQGPLGLITVPTVTTDDETRNAINALIEATFEAMSTPGSAVDRIFDSPDIAVSGSGVGELFYGPEAVVGAATAVSSRAYRWTPETVTVWRRGEVAWAQILGRVRISRNDETEEVPYWTSGIFGFENGRWQWLYWGGAEPQDPPRA